MKKTIASIVAVIAFSGPASAQQPAPQNAVPDAVKAKVKAQVEAMQKVKSDDAARATQKIKDEALKKGSAIDERAKLEQQRLDGISRDYIRLGGEVNKRKEAVDAEAKARKQKIAADAKAKAAREAAIAGKAASNIQESVSGLKSQVAKPGQYGLQPKGSSMYVRQYGAK